MKRLTPIMLACALLLTGRAAAQERIQIAEKDAIVLGQKIHYLEAGRGAPVILLHGTGGEGARWMPTIQGLAGSHRIIAIDHIGFGQSDKPLTNYHTGVYAGFLKGLMKTIGVSKASLIGQSMGAGVALYFTIHNPEMVDRLVLVNGAGFRAAGAAPVAPRVMTPEDWHARQIANAGTLEESREYLEKLFYNDSLVTDKLVESNLVLRLKSAYAVEHSVGAERGLGVTTEEQVRALKTPTLLAWGKDDVQATVAGAERLRAAIPGARLVLIDKAGHYPFLEHPEEFNRVVLEFLKAST